jgi:hypothetical protein
MNVHACRQRRAESQMVMAGAEPLRRQQQHLVG